jgi:DNA-binding response OmpR family regulator
MPDMFLIVEDHPEQADLLARILRLKYRTETILVREGRIALELARKHIPDVMFLDLMLPDINGFDVCRALRTDPETMLIPVVMVTALNDVQHRVHGFRVGATAYVTKPYGVNDLVEVIAAARTWRASMGQRTLHGEIHVELNSEITLLKDLNDFLMVVCQATPLLHEQVMQLRQAVMEMAHNAIEWGNLHQSDCLVNITYRIHEDRLEIVVQDQGPGFDRSALPHAAVPDDPFSHLDVREKGYDLQLMSWGDGSNVPTSGQRLVIAGLDANGLLHIRTFDPAGVRTDTYEAMEGSELHLVSADASGNVLSDSPESRLTAARSQAIAYLKALLPGLLPPPVLSVSEKDQVLSKATLITGHTLREKLGLRAGGFGLLICRGMVDEMRYNDQGNEVVLIKRFASRETA